MFGAFRICFLGVKKYLQTDVFKAFQDTLSDKTAYRLFIESAKMFIDSFRNIFNIKWPFIRQGSYYTI